MALHIVFDNDCPTLHSMESLGQRIRRLRKLRGINQTDLALACGIDQSTVSDIARDHNDAFSGKVLFKMADALGATPSFLMFGESGNALTEAELLHSFRRLDAEAQAALVRMASALAAQSGSPPKPNERQ